MDYLEIRELYHHGIKGQRWGIRRFQNEDGSLTPEGKQRYEVNTVTKIDRNGVTTKQQQMSKEGKKLYKQDLKDTKIAKRSSFGNTSLGALKGSAIAAAGVTAAIATLGAIGIKSAANSGSSAGAGYIGMLTLAGLGVISSGTGAAMGAGAAIGGISAHQKQKKARERSGYQK